MDPGDETDTESGRHSMRTQQQLPPPRRFVPPPARVQITRPAAEVYEPFVERNRAYFQGLDGVQSSVQPSPDSDLLRHSNPQPLHYGHVREVEPPHEPTPRPHTYPTPPPQQPLHFPPPQQQNQQPPPSTAINVYSHPQSMPQPPPPQQQMLMFSQPSPYAAYNPPSTSTEPAIYHTRYPITTLFEFLLLMTFVVLLYALTPMSNYYPQLQDLLLIAVHTCVVLTNSTDMGVILTATVDISVLTLQIYRWVAASEPVQSTALDVAKVILTAALFLCTSARIVQIFMAPALARCFSSSSSSSSSPISQTVRQHAQ